MKERQQNPYVAPASQIADAPASTALYLKWKMKGIFGGAAICTAVSGVFVLICQIVFDRTTPPPSHLLLPMISIVTVPIPIAFVFGATAWGEEFGRCGIRAGVFSGLLVLGLITSWKLTLGLLVPVCFLVCYLVLPAAICWIRRVPIRVKRLIGLGIVSPVVWFVLFTSATLLGNTCGQWLPHAQYVELTLFTMTWSIVASFGSAFMLEPSPPSSGLALRKIP